jgi:hypothetical protein
MCGKTAASMALAAIIASMAVPPASRIRIPAALASAWGVQMTARAEVAIMIKGSLFFASYQYIYC